MDDDFRVGIRDSLPFHLGVIPYGLITGIAGIEAGLTAEQIIGMSAIVYAGASQLAALELLGTTAPLAIVVGTAAVINLRLLMYSASMAPHFAERKRTVRAGVAFFLSDHAYVRSVMEFKADESLNRLQYYLGLAVSIWLIWVLSTALGAGLGASVPPGLELSFAVPLVFLALLVPAMKDRATTATGIVAGIGALIGAAAPFNLGLVFGAIAGIAAGRIVETRWGR